MRRFGRSSKGSAPPRAEDDNGEAGNQQEQQPIGLFQLWPDPELTDSSEVERDVQYVLLILLLTTVIAIHGLGGHAYKTWTDGQKLWLRDFLPKDLPRTRIMTFGYNSGLAFTKSKSTIRDFAIQLLESLKRLMRKSANDSVKTIFVCHSLGGIVFKEALIVAHERGNVYGSVTESVKGVIFLGTPHQGSDIAQWSSLLTKVANVVVLGGLRQDLLDNLKPKSAELHAISTQFVERGMGLQIFSLYERLTMRGTNTLVVDEFSAILKLPNERAIPLEADHQTMCKFLTSSNPSYMQVRDCIDEIIDSLVKISDKTYFTPAQDMFFRTLRIINEVDMLRRVPLPWGESHQWLFQNQAFQSWMAYQGYRVLWLRGPPGSGKTVLSKTVILYLSKLSETTAASSRDDVIRKTVYFFFDDKDPKTQTGAAFVSSILYQILDDSRTAFAVKYLDKMYLSRMELDEETLWTCLLSIIQECTGIIFHFVVDAVDELYRVKGSNTAVLERLEALLSVDLTGHMRLLITDRANPNEGFYRSAHPAVLDVDNLDTHQMVEEYIRAQVRGQLERSRVNPKAGIEVEAKIMELSRGNFLMASLTWKQFSDGIDLWSRDTIQRRLREIHKISTDLETVYCNLLKSLPMQWRSEACRAFSILRISFERLSSKQLSFFVTIWKFDTKSPRFDLRVVEDERSDFEIYLYERCGYIVRKNDNGRVNFAHQSAKDLFADKPTTQENAIVLRQFSMSESDAHSIMFRMCIKTFNAEGNELSKKKILSIIKESIDEVDPYLELERRAIRRIAALKTKIQNSSRTSCLLYALLYWFEHYLKATPSYELDLEACKFFTSSYGMNFHLLWCEMAVFSKTVAQHIEVTKFSHPLFNAIVRGDSGRLMRAMLDSGANPNVFGPNDITPLRWSIICDRQEIFSAMMRSDYVSINLAKKDRYTAVHEAARSENPFFLQRMIADSRTNLNARAYHDETPLTMAILYRRPLSVDLLLEQPYVAIWSEVGRRMEPLCLAFENPMWEKAALKMMLKDWNKALRTSMPMPRLLELARMHRWTQIENELLTRSHDELFHGWYDNGLNPINLLAFYGRRVDFLHYLETIPYELIIKLASAGHYNMLHLCANQNWEDIVRRLMKEYEMKSLPCDHVNRTLLHWALDFSWEIDESDILHLSAGHIDQQDRDGSSALHLAILHRNLTVAGWLVNAKADIFLKDKRGFTPAHLAAEDGYRQGVEFFINLTTQDFGVTREGATLIHLMSLWLEGSLIKRFKESRHTSVNIVDKNKCIPLHYAAQTGNVSAVQALLEKGSRIDARDSRGRTPLHHAIRSGTSDVAPLLLDHDADIDMKDYHGQTCLHMSIRHQHEGLTRWLLPRRPESIWEIDQFGFTPLHRACFGGTEIEVLDLLDRGADYLERDSKFRTPLELAVIGRNQSAVAVLLQSQKDEHDAYRNREWIRSMNAALRLSIAKRLSKIEKLLKNAGAWTVDHANIEIERFYLPEEVGENRWPLVTYRFWDQEFAKDSYDPSTGRAQGPETEDV